MTYEQALAVAQAGETDEDILIIDGVTRAIMVPSGQQFFGVMTDKDVERRKFRCPKVVGDNIDLSQMHLYIHYENGAGKAGAYMIRDMAVNGDYITFSWVLGENLLLYKGTVNFLLCAKKADTNGIIKNVWNTLPAEGTVSEGMEAVDVVEESRNPDVIEQMLVLLENVSDQPNIANVQVRENIKAGDKVPTLWGKVRKWFLDLGTAAFCSVVNNLAYEAENGVLDARQGKKLNEAIAKINKTLGDSDISAIGDGTVTNAISTLNSKPTPSIINESCNFTHTGSGKYEYTNVKIIIPKGSIAILKYEAVWNKGKPSGAALSKSDTVLDDFTIASKCEDIHPICNSYILKADADLTTLYVWAKYSVKGTENIKICGIILN